MREIKFRAWDNIYKQIWDWDRLIKNINLNDIFEPNDKNFILMQYTGLRDKNGKEIYEGDILAVEDHVNHIVGFKHAMFMWRNIAPDIPIYKKLEQYNCEIIGNIYENPGLLKR